MNEEKISEAPLDPERRARLHAVVAAMDLALGEEWFYLCIIGKPGDKTSVNMVGNCSQQVADKFLDAMIERRAQGRGPEEFA